MKAVRGGLKVGLSPLMRITKSLDADKNGQDLKKDLETCLVWYDYIQKSKFRDIDCPQIYFIFFVPKFQFFFYRNLAAV